MIVPTVGSHCLGKLLLTTGEQVGQARTGPLESSCVHVTRITEGSCVALLT